MYIFDYGLLRQLRKQKKMSQREVAARLHCSAPVISKIELGECAVSAEKLAELATIYGAVDMQRFFVKTIEKEDLNDE